MNHENGLTTVYIFFGGNMAKLYGEHAVSALLMSEHMEITELYVETNRQSDYSVFIKSARERRVQVSIVKLLSNIFPNVRHQGVGASFNFSYAKLNNLDFNKPLRLLMLDRVQDPHNFGACMRSAAAFGVDAAIVPQRGQSPINEVVHQVSCGGSLIVPIIQVSNLRQVMTELKDKGLWFVATSEYAEESLTDIPLDRSLCLVMGSEGEGLKRVLLEACDYKVAIETPGKLSTLNVSVATGILLHAMRQSALK